MFTRDFTTTRTRHNAHREAYLIFRRAYLNQLLPMSFVMNLKEVYAKNAVLMPRRSVPAIAA